MVVRVVGRSQGHPVMSTVAVIYKRGLEYWINGVVPATLARLIAEGNSVQPGVNFLLEAVDPAAFLAQLQDAGIELTEKLDEGTP